MIKTKEENLEDYYTKEMFLSFCKDKIDENILSVLDRVLSTGQKRIFLCDFLGLNPKPHDGFAAVYDTLKSESLKSCLATLNKENKRKESKKEK